MKGTQKDPEVFLVQFCQKFNCHLRTDVKYCGLVGSEVYLKTVFWKLFEKISPVYPYSCKWSRDQYSHNWNRFRKVSENFWLISVSYDSVHLLFPGWLLCRLQAKWTIIWLLLNFWSVPCSPQSVDVSYAIHLAHAKALLGQSPQNTWGSYPRGSWLIIFL